MVDPPATLERLADEFASVISENESTICSTSTFFEILAVFTVLSGCISEDTYIEDEI